MVILVTMMMIVLLHDKYDNIDDSDKQYWC